MKSDSETEKMLRDGLNAHERLQEAINTARELLHTLQIVPELDELGDDLAKARADEVEGLLVDMIFDAIMMRDSLTGVDETLQGYSVAYRESYKSVPNAYRSGRKDAIRDLHAGLGDHPRRVLRRIANALALLDDEECYQVCEQLCASLPGKKRG